MKSDVYDKGDRTQITDIITTMRQEYDDRLHEATTTFNKAQHEMNRAQHELRRLERHLDRITGFCSQHNIVLDGQK